MLRFALLVLLLCLPSLATAADVPYTGNLFESGTPVNGTRTISLAVYNVASGGSPLYTQAAPLDVSNGVFHTVLVVPDGTWFGGDRWIGVSINGGPELAPRVKYYAPPRPGTQFVEHPSTTRSVTSNAWTKVDSLTITTATPGTAIVSHAGTAQWTGSITVTSIGFDISPSLPTSLATYIYPTQSGTVDPVNFTVMVPLSSGTTTIYFWARLGSAGQSFSLNSARFQALFIPN